MSIKDDYPTLTIEKEEFTPYKFESKMIEFKPLDMKSHLEIINDFYDEMLTNALMKLRITHQYLYHRVTDYAKYRRYLRKEYGQ